MIKKPFISLKIQNKKGELIGSMGTRKRKKILYFLQAKKFKDCVFNLHVNHGKFKNNKNKIISFTDDGIYKTKTDLINAIRMFAEK